MALSQNGRQSDIRLHTGDFFFFFHLSNCFVTYWGKRSLFHILSDWQIQLPKLRLMWASRPLLRSIDRKKKMGRSKFRGEVV